MSAAVILVALVGALGAGMVPALVAWARGIPTGIYRAGAESETNS